MSEVETLEAELRAGLEGVTPGPWTRETEAEEWQDEDQPQVYVCSPGTTCDLTVVATMGRSQFTTQEQKQADGAHIARCFPQNIRALLDELSRLREVERKLKTALTLTPMAERLAELPDFMVALSEWGCEDPNEQAAAITDFLNSLVGLKQYLEEARR